MADQPKLYVRLQSASNPDKSLAQLLALRREGKLRQAIVVAEHINGEVILLGQMADVPAMAGLLVVAAEALPQGEKLANEAGLRTRRSTADDPPEPLPAHAIETTAATTEAKQIVSIAALWAEFEQAVFTNRPDVDKIQRRETQKAFYAGCFSLFNLFTDPAVFSEGDEIADSDVGIMASLQSELERFFDVVKKEGEAHARKSSSDQAPTG